jgi:WS/DGAT/MGAT family acyltransferase
MPAVSESPLIPLAPLDAGFLLTESETTTWHVLGVLVLDASTASAPITVERVRQLVRERLPTIEAFRLRLAGGWPTPHWVETSQIDLDHHVVRADLPAGAGLDDLARLAGDVASRPLDRSRPLWELHVAEHLAGDRAGLVAKVHHALADGVAAVGILAALFDLEPAPPPVEVPSLEPLPDRGRRGTLIRNGTAALVAWPLRAARAGVRLAGSAWSVLRGARRAGGLTLPFAGPRTGLHQPLTSARQATLATLPLDDVRVVKSALGGTFNDVVLAVTAGALRRWMAAGDGVPDRPLVAAVPASVRPDHGGDPRLRNQVSVLMVPLPTHLEDPGARFDAVRRGTAASKAAHEQFGSGTLSGLAAAAPWRALALLWRASWRVGTAHLLPPVVNLVLSNVPGPPVPLYLAGGRLVGLFPLGPLLEGVPLNVTVVSREDALEVGILSCPDTTPDTAPLAGWFAEALGELVELTPP